MYLTIVLSLFACLSGNYSQIIGPEELKFSGFDGGHPGAIITKLVKIGWVAYSYQTIWLKGL